MNKILLPSGITVGNADNSVTGVTAIIARDGAIAGVDVRGCAPGTRETDALKSDKAVEKAHAIVLCGGSAYGLDACSGVMKFLCENGIGHRMGEKVVPIVAGAVIYDLNGPDYNYPSSEMGYLAASSASVDFARGKAGVGVGATCGKIRGAQFCSDSGLGASTVGDEGLFVTAIVAVNALGDVYDHESGNIIAGAHDNAGGFLDTRKCIITGNFSRLMYGTNTTIGCVITNATLTKVQANKLASVAHNGLAQSIKPVHTDYDGDTIFAMSCGSAVVQDFTILQVMAQEAVSRAITDSIRSIK